MHDPTLEDSNERDRIAGSWSSPVYPLVFFLVAMPLEWWPWKDAPFMQLGWQVVLGLSIVVAAVPWIGSVAHPADSAALRRHPARFAFVLPALALHLAIFALYGPYWRSGAGDGSVTIHRLVTALREPAQMSTLLVEAVARTGEDPSEVLRDIALLRRLGADVNAPAPDGRYPLDAAARPEALAALLDSGARRHSDQVSAQLRRLVDADDLATLGRLLALGVDPDLVESTEPSGVTALQWAARWEHVEAFDALLAAGARLDRTDRHGRTALDHAHNGGSTAVLERIAQHQGQAQAQAQAQAPAPEASASQR